MREVLIAPAEPRLRRPRLACGRTAWRYALAVLFSACASPGPPPGAPSGAGVPAAEPAVGSLSGMPEGASGTQSKPGWQFKRYAVAAASPLAAEAGASILAAGGNALDAAIAVQMVLGLVEPQSSGIGGGAFLMFWDGREIAAWDGRETAPAAADERLFLRADGRPMAMDEAIVGGRAVGVPGAVAMLERAHRAHGALPWPRLFEPAIALAEAGFAVSPRLHQLLAAEGPQLHDAQARGHFFGSDGRPHAVGHRLKNPAYAAVLRSIAENGAAALSRGRAAADIVRRVRSHANAGVMVEADLAAYEPLRRSAICTVWLQRWRVCGFPPPSSGHLTLMQILGLLERAEPAAPGGAIEASASGAVPRADWLHRFAEASRLAFADRARYIADPAFVAAPGGDWATLLDAGYLARRASLIGARAMREAAPGEPAPAAAAIGRMPEQVESGTSHISVVDAEGRAVAMTTTIEAAFGARLMSDGGTGLAGGFLLNNQLTDFALAPRDAHGRPIANRVQPGKRPRSSMSPTLVFDRPEGGRLVMTLGSPGGAAIIHFTAKTLLGTLSWGLDPQRAIDLPNFANFNGPTLVEQGRFPTATIEALRARGHRVAEVELTSGLQALQRRGAVWLGGADPRREGAVAGQ